MVRCRRGRRLMVLHWVHGYTNAELAELEGLRPCTSASTAATPSCGSPSSPRSRRVLPDPATRPCLSADEAFGGSGIDRTTGYRAIQEGTFPMPVIRVGRLIRVPTPALRQLLQTGVAPAPGDGYSRERASALPDLGAMSAPSYSA